MALDNQELKLRRIKGLNKIRTDLRIQFKEIAELGIDIDQLMMDIHKNLDLILIKLGYVQKEPYTGPERGNRDQSGAHSGRSLGSSLLEKHTTLKGDMSD